MFNIAIYSIVWGKNKRILSGLNFLSIIRDKKKMDVILDIHLYLLNYTILRAMGK